MTPLEGIAGIQRPKLRQGVMFSLADGHARLTYHGRKYELAFPPDGRSAVAGLLNSLETGGQTLAQLSMALPQFGGELDQVLSELDAFRLLTESETNVSEGLISGHQLYREIVRAVDRLERRFATGPFVRRLMEGTATRRQLIGYVLEYHWLVRIASSLIAPAVAAAESPAERRLLERFLVSEIGHDAYLRRSLAAVDVELDKLDLVQPLPSTFGVGASLGVYAKQHPLSFKAVLFLFERPRHDFIAAFERHCLVLRLPNEFYRPLGQHAELNRDSEHEAISGELMEHVAVVDGEMRAVTMRHVAILVETLLRQEHEIVSYYGDLARPFPRLFV